MAKYPDISHHHPVQDWNLVKENVGFIISKATQGTRFVDSTLKSFVKNCEANQIPYWLYTYLNKGNERGQAEFLVDTCKPLIGPFFVGYALDAEEDNEEDNLILALNWIKTQSKRSMIYCGWSDYTQYKRLISSRGENVAWWEARYGKDSGSYNPLYPCHKGVDLHQYTSEGTCPGIPDKIDMNRLTGAKSLKWFQGIDENAPVIVDSKKPYSGKFPEIPYKGYFTLGDGYKQNVGLKMDVKKVQELVNWINGGKITVDGCYGPNTVAAVKLAQTNMKVYPDGLFGPKTLMAAKAYKK